MATDRRNIRFVVVEQAGYVGERDGAAFHSATLALKHVQETYDADELDRSSPNCLNVGIRMDWTDADGEQSEYIA